MASFQEKETELDREVRVYLSNPSNLETAAEAVLNDLVDTVVLGIVFDVHRAAKIGLVDMEDGIAEEINAFDIDEGPDGDIFGQDLKKVPLKKPPNPECPSCKRTPAAVKFVPHLEKCMNMGRSSSRIASQRIANNSKESVGYGGISDDDSELSLGSDRRRKKKERNGTRRPKNQKTGRNGDVGDTETCSEFSSSITSYDSMSYEEKKNLLTQICGVISVNTRKLCTRSMRCPQHSYEQRKAVRMALLQPRGSSTITSNIADIHIINEKSLHSGILLVDVDSCEDEDGQSMRESLGHNWEQEHSNTSSPADSASTSSSSSKKREKIPTLKNNNNNKSSSKHHKGSPSFVSCMQE